MDKLRAHPRRLTLAAFGVAVAALLAVAAAFGFGKFIDAWGHLSPGWLIVAVVVELLTIPAYAVAYRSLLSFNDGPKLKLPLVLMIVTAGFAPFAPAGGFVLDRRALRSIVGDEDAAAVHVLGLGALEWALLAPAAWLCAVILLVGGDPRPMTSLLWPWVLAVPIGFVAGLWVAAKLRHRWQGATGWRGRMHRALDAVNLLPSLARYLPGCMSTWVGMTLYWVFDIAAFWAACRFVGLHLNLGEAVLAYATGYALTRRSLPLGGAGVIEVLMTFALHWVGQPVTHALAAVAVYRIFNLALPAGPALAVRRHVRSLIRDPGAAPAQQAQARRQRVAVGDAAGR